MKRSAVFLALCISALTVSGRPVEEPRDSTVRVRERVVRIVRSIISLGDGLTPPWPSPKP